MIKFLASHTNVVFAEVPDEVTLAISLTNCKFHCPECNQKELWRNIGEELTIERLDKLIQANIGITCVCFMGEGGEKINALNARARHIRKKYPLLKIALYTGRAIIPQNLSWELFDYVKTGPYMSDRGSLRSPTTNQRLYQIVHTPAGHTLVDITYKFWKKHENPIRSQGSASPESH